MKRGIALFFALFLLLGSISFIIADVIIDSPPRMDDSDVILWLSSDTNAHGELWNGDIYQTAIRYSTIFGKVYSGSAPIRTPVLDAPGLTNFIVALSSATNAHADSDLLDGAYSSTTANFVYYGDLKCTYRPGGECQGDERCIVTMSSNTNAHLAKCGVAGAYANKVCCSSASAGVVDCEDYTTRDGCWSGYPTQNCTWTSKVNQETGEQTGHCCPEDYEWDVDVGRCSGTYSKICTIPFTLIVSALRTGGLPAAINILKQQTGDNNIDSIYDTNRGPLDKEADMYCSQISSGINTGIWGAVHSY